MRNPSDNAIEGIGPGCPFSSGTVGLACANGDRSQRSAACLAYAWVPIRGLSWEYQSGCGQDYDCRCNGPAAEAL